MKKITIIFAMAMIAMSAWAQTEEMKDLIYTSDNKAIEAKIVEVSSQEVKYKDWNNQNGPMFILTAAEISKIEFSNGTVKTFAAPANPAPAKPVTTEDKADAPQTKKTAEKLPVGFQFNIDVDGNLAFLNGFSAEGYSVKNFAVGGVNLALGAGVRVAEWLFAGVAAGVLGEWGNPKVVYKGEEGKGIYSAYTVPIYADVRAYAPTHGNCYPYAEVGIGGYVGIYGNVKMPEFEANVTPNGGFYLLTGVGLEFKYLNVGAGYKMMRNSDFIGNHGYVKIGFSFGRCNKLRNK